MEDIKVIFEGWRQEDSGIFTTVFLYMKENERIGINLYRPNLRHNPEVDKVWLDEKITDTDGSEYWVPMSEYQSGSSVLTYQQAAEYLGVHPRTVMRWVNSGKIPAFKFGSGTTRIKREDLENIDK